MIPAIISLTASNYSGRDRATAYSALGGIAAAGAAALSMMPDTDVTLALIAGMSAAITVGMGKPIAAILIVGTLRMIQLNEFGPLRSRLWPALLRR